MLSGGVSPGLPQLAVRYKAQTPTACQPGGTSNGMSAGQYKATPGGKFPVQNGSVTDTYQTKILWRHAVMTAKAAEPRYSALHSRLRRVKGSADRCIIFDCHTGNTNFQWANISGHYDDSDDFMPMCLKHHRQYDYLRSPGRGSSQYVGVRWDKGSRKWAAMMHINGKSTRLGLFDDELEAKRARDRAELLRFSNGPIDRPAKRGGRHHTKLTEAIVAKCRERFANGEPQTALAREFGVTSVAMSYAVTGKHWKQVPMVGCLISSMSKE